MYLTMNERHSVIERLLLKAHIFKSFIFNNPFIL